MSIPKYGTDVTTLVLLGDHEWAVTGSYHPETGVDIADITLPCGQLTGRLKASQLPQHDRDRVEQAIVDCYTADEDSPMDKAIDRAMYERKARLEDR